MSEPSFFWHDYETTGTDPRRDRVLQFAGVRTDFDLQTIAEPVSLFCRPPRDSLPQPQATMITGITPQRAQAQGLIEAQFAAAVLDCLGQPGTCGVGYNSLRFDDAFTRHLLYRNFHDPYQREWANGNSRWDIIDLARMCYALRPDGIEWPCREDGAPSFKLEDLAEANRLQKRRAHDALSDVETTVDLARLLRQRQPRLWEWYLRLRNKRIAASLLDVTHMTPLLHVSSRYPAQQGCLRMIAPLAQHPTRSNEVIVVDLTDNPVDLLMLDAEAIADRVFTPRADLPDGIERIALRSVHINRAPALAPLSVLKGVDTARIGLDVERCLAHAAHLRNSPGIAGKVRTIFAAATDMPPAEDVELDLYGSFLPDADRPLLTRVRTTPPEQLGSGHLPFRDPRYRDLLFRYRARNWPQTLTPDEQRRWLQFRRQRLTHETPLTTLTLDRYFAEITALRGATSGPPLVLLDQLEAWGRELALEVGVAID